MDSRGHSGAASTEKEEHVIGNLKKGDHGYKVAKNLAELCLWEVELEQ